VAATTATPAGSTTPPAGSTVASSISPPNCPTSRSPTARDGVDVRVTGDLVDGSTRFEFAVDSRPAFVAESVLTFDFRGTATLGYGASESYRYTTPGVIGRFGREHVYQARTLRGKWFPHGTGP
jgi:hypothetical protein